MSEDNDSLPKSDAKRPPSRKRPPPVIEGKAEALPDGERGVPEKSRLAGVEAAMSEVTGDVVTDETMTGSRETSAPKQAPSTADNANASRARPFIAPILAGGLGGLAASGLMIAAVYWLASPLLSEPKTDLKLQDLPARLAALESKVETLAARPQPREVSGEIGRLGGDLAGLRQGLQALEGKLATAGNAAPADKTRGEEIAALGQKFAALEQKFAGLGNNAQLAGDIASLRREMTARLATAGDTKALLLVAVDLIKSAIDRGEAYEGELEAARGLGLDPAIAEKLAKDAKSGLSTARQLAELFKNRIGPMLDAVQEKPGSLAERLVQSLTHLVRIRPAGEVAGSAPGAVIARIEAKLERGDLAGAASEFSGLPEKARAAAAPIPDLLSARLAADGLLKGLIAELAKGLPGKGKQG